MKTNSIGLIGITMLGALAVGCGAEPAEETSVGETKQALSLNTTPQDLAAIDSDPGTPAMDTAPGREFAASCKITVDNVERTLAVGGFDSSGGGLRDAYIYTPSTGNAGSWSVADPLPAGQGRGLAQMLRVADDKCLLAGGIATKGDNSSVQTQAYLYTAGSGWSPAGTITGRIMFGMSECGTGSKVIVFNGLDEDSLPLNTVQVYNGETGTTAWTTLNPGLAARFGFGFGTHDNQKFFIYSGSTGAGLADTIDLLTVNESCSSLDVVSKSINTVGGKTLKGHVVLPTDQTDKFAVTAGDDNANLNRDADVYAVTDWDLGTISRTANPNVLNTGVRSPTVVKAGSAYLLIGGEDRSSSTLLAGTPLDNVSKITFSSSTPSETNTTLDTERLGSIAEHFSDAYAFFGRDATPTLLTSGVAITP